MSTLIVGLRCADDLSEVVDCPRFAEQLLPSKLAKIRNLPLRLQKSVIPTRGRLRSAHDLAKLVHPDDLGRRSAPATNVREFSRGIDESSIGSELSLVAYSSDLTRIVYCCHASATAIGSAISPRATSILPPTH